MQTEEIVDEISILTRQLAQLRQKITSDPLRPGTLATSARDLFVARMPPDTVTEIGSPQLDLGMARIEYLENAGLQGVVRQPVKSAPHLSPPEYERRFAIEVLSPGESPWLTLRLEIGAREFATARSLWWELAGSAIPAFEMHAILRLYGAGGSHSDHPVGHGSLTSRRDVFSADIALGDIEQAASPDLTGQALYFFLQPRPGQVVELDYLIAHVD